MQRRHLKHGEKGRNRRQRRPHFLRIDRKSLGKQAPQLPAVPGLRHHRRHIASRRRVCQCQRQHRQHRPHGAQRHQTEAVLAGLAVTSGGGHAQAQRHDERHGHRPGGHTAGVKGHRQKILGGKGRQSEDHHVGRDQQAIQWDLEQDTQQCYHQKDPHAHGHRPDQDGVGDPRHLPRQNLKIRFRNGDDDADEQADTHHHPQLPGFGHLCAHPLTNGEHGGIRTQSKQAHTHDQQHGAYQERQQHVRWDRSRGKTQDQHDQGNGHHGGQRLPHLFTQYRFRLADLVPPLLPQSCKQTHRLLL